MRFTLPVFAKLNLTLRVVGRRPDGYHNLTSVFLRIPSGETLFVTPDADEDSVEMTGLDLSFTGENIVSKALRLAREAGGEIPPVRVRIAKALYPGSGLGSGSGNAAAMLRWLAPRYPGLPWDGVAIRVGADVPFLFSGAGAALVSGTGERVESVDALPLNGCVVFPSWDVGTGGAYAALDAAYPGGYPMDAAGAREEIDRILSRLRREERVGLLPNDFTPPLLAAHPQYEELFAMFEGAGSLCWGITGSGGAAFALYAGGEPVMRCPEWTRQILLF